ncbi:hypothetical protein BJV77DRAFT_1064828 [Russula vinacea]|nr:hypothetical protein BJV77DRAFT_1064828 [Russula vinacea]
MIPISLHGVLVDSATLLQIAEPRLITRDIAMVYQSPNVAASPLVAVATNTVNTPYTSLLGFGLPTTAPGKKGPTEGVPLSGEPYHYTLRAINRNKDDNDNDMPGPDYPVLLNNLLRGHRTGNLTRYFEYVMSKDGPEDNVTHYATAKFRGVNYTVGRGKSKGAAKAAAAQMWDEDTWSCLLRGADISASVQNPVVLDTRLDTDNALSFNSVNSDSILQPGTRKLEVPVSPPTVESEIIRKAAQLLAGSSGLVAVNAFSILTSSSSRDEPQTFLHVVSRSHNPPNEPGIDEAFSHSIYNNEYKKDFRHCGSAFDGALSENTVFLPFWGVEPVVICNYKT